VLKSPFESGAVSKAKVEHQDVPLPPPCPRTPVLHSMAESLAASAQRSFSSWHIQPAPTRAMATELKESILKKERGVGGA